MKGVGEFFARSYSEYSMRRTLHDRLNKDNILDPNV